MRPIQNITNNERLVRDALRITKYRLADEILNIHNNTDLLSFTSKIGCYRSLFCFDTTNILLILHFGGRLDIKPTYLMTREQWRGLGRYVQRGSTGLPILVDAGGDFKKIGYVYDVSQSWGEELGDFSMDEISTGSIYHALTTISEELGIEFIDIHDCDDVLTYVLEEVVFALVSKENTRLSELQLLTLSGLVSAILADTYNIPYTISDFTFQEDFTRDTLARSIPDIFEVLRNVITVFNKLLIN